MPDWPHAPLHRFAANGIYFITGATYLKQHFYRLTESLNRLQDRLFALAREHECTLQAWALFSNHYHLVAQSEGERLRRMLSHLHSVEAIACNKIDGVAGRKVWYQFWDTELTFQRSWMARLRYTHENAVRHRLVAHATDYPWCSAGWFERTATRSLVETVRRFGVERIRVLDEFDVVGAEGGGKPPHSMIY